MTNKEFIESIRLNNEEWKDVPGFEGLYMVSSLGRVAKMGRNLYYRNYTKYRGPALSKQVTTRGYNNVGLSGKGRTKSVGVHRIVALAFIPNPDKYPEIDHINGDRMDNRVENLRWCNRSMNMMNSITRERCSKARKGVRHPKLWKPVVQLKEERFIKRFDNIFSVEEYGFDKATVVQICKYGNRKVHKGFEWMYESEYLKREKIKRRYRKND